MKDINAEIPYKWKWGWNTENMNSYPRVNMLIKAMLESDIPEIRRLFREGAAIEKTDDGTFCRAIYHVVSDYEVIECLVENGYECITHRLSKHGGCINPEGYYCSLIERVWEIESYDVLDLLTQKGFSEDSVDHKMFCTDDIYGMTILMENGYSREKLLRLMRKYPESKVTYHFKKNFLVQRKSMGLDNCKFSDIPRPEIKKLGIFNRKENRKYNQIMEMDYEDRISAQKEFIREYGGRAKWEERKKNEQIEQEETAELMIRVMKMRNQ